VGSDRAAVAAGEEGDGSAVSRNVVERFFNRMKHWRALASRYDKYAVVYRGGIILAAIVDWLKHL
jgi:transposase